MNKVTRNIAALIAFGLGTASIGFAQVTQQKIGNNPTLINPNAALEVESTNKGILLPRLGLTATNSFAPLAAHVAGMTVYNTATAGTAPNNVTPGYYYNDGTQWVRVATGADAKTEPWREQNTTNEATANSQSIYQTGSVAVGDFSTAASTKKMEVKGDFKSEITAAGGATGTEVGSPLNPNGAMHYWFSSPTNYRIASASDQRALLQAVSGTTTNAVSASDIQSEMSSVNGTNSLSTARTLNTGEFRLESYNVADNFGSTVSLQNDGLRLRHTNTNGAADPFPLNNSSEIFVQKANGVRFNFRDAAAVQTGEYWFPTTSGTNGQVMTQTATGKMVWSNPSTLFSEVDGVIGNEVTDATANGGLTRSGAGTTASPYTLGLTPGTATGNVMTWNGTAWNPAAPVNIYNANGSLTSPRLVTFNGNSLRFTSPQRDILFDNEGRIGVEAKGTDDADIYLASGTGATYNRLDIQSFPTGEVQLLATGAGARDMSIGTHITTVPAPLLFVTSAGSDAFGEERMRITGTGNVGVNTISPTEKLDNDGITRLRNLPLNGATNAINTTSAGTVSAAQDQTFTATRTVVADANGVLGTVAGLPAAPVNIYNANGTLTANRTVNLDSKLLTFSTAGNGHISFNTTNSGSASHTITGATNRGNLTLNGGNATVDLYVDNNAAAQLTSRANATSLNVGTGNGQVKPLHLVTEGIIRATVTGTGEVAIGATTAPSFVVGGTTIQPKLHVAGDISTTGKLWTTNSVYADYVFEKYFKGSSEIKPDYEFKSLDYVKEFIQKEHHLPGVESISNLSKTENGYTFDMTKLTVQSLEKIEELYLHTIELKEKLEVQYQIGEQQEKMIQSQQKELEELKNKFSKLEELLIKK